MPPNFQNSKIYTIRSHQTKRVFVGTTTQALHKAFYEHKKLRHASRVRYTESIMQFADCYIEFLEYFPCSNKTELTQKVAELQARFDIGDSI